MTPLPIAIDAMGGDHAPQAIVRGAAQAAAELRVPIALVGREEAIQAELAACESHEGLVTVVHAPDVIGMDEPPSSALRRKSGASVLVAAEMVRRGEASAMISAGNSGAAVGASLLRLGKLPGIARPAIAMIVPGRRGEVVLLDVGANADCSAKHLVQYGVMGSVYARRVLGLTEPRVGLLSIGEEPSKGSALVKAAHEMLQKAPILFVGNVEGRDVFAGEVDVAVCDGFVGNVALKMAEGFAELFMDWALAEFERDQNPDAAPDRTRRVLGELRKKLDYAEYGGAALLGVNGVCIISHGRSSPRAIVGAVRVADRLAREAIVEGIASLLRAKSAARLGPTSDTGEREA